MILSYNIGINLHISRATYFTKELNLISERVKSSLKYIPDFLKNRDGNIAYEKLFNSNEFEDLTEEYYDEPQKLLEKLVDKKVRNNFLIGVMGELVITDLADYYDDKSVHSIVADKFVFGKSGEIYLSLRIDAEHDTDLSALYTYIDGQVSDGWGENGSEPVEYWAGNLKSDIFKKYIYGDSIEVALSNLKVLESEYTTSDSIPDYLRDEFRRNFEAFLYKPAVVSIRLSMF